MKTKIQVFMVDDNKDVVTEVKKYFSSKNVGVEIVGSCSNGEDALNELETIVKELESGNVNLDDAINKYTEAMKLAKECSDKIKNAEDIVSKSVKENGELEDFEVDVE